MSSWLALQGRIGSTGPSGGRAARAAVQLLAVGCASTARGCGRNGDLGLHPQASASGFCLGILLAVEIATP